ncbi:hypothetical protein M5D96_003901 [Drosophila gunungcola]|uniref:Uncharacterized protein n=2 Tax=Drosophila gunungcola TaxID=103775 RepID=A0A9P9YT18_9MUSC|nr:hypothetical protein M5D96_003901 [Drosophila gunungcola]
MKSAVLQETPVRRKPTAKQGQGTAGSNDSSTATLTASVVTVAKFPGPGLVSTVTSLNGCGTTYSYTTTTAASQNPAAPSKRNTKYSPVPNSEVYQCDPLQQSSTEIIL